MKTFHILARPAGALLIAAALVAGILALAPGQAEALGPRCFCPPLSETAHGWGMHASSCATARNLCLQDAQAKAGQYCASAFGTTVCQTGGVQYFPASGCVVKNGMKVVDCDLEYSCDQCLDLP